MIWKTKIEKRLTVNNAKSRFKDALLESWAHYIAKKNDVKIQTALERHWEKVNEHHEYVLQNIHTDADIEWTIWER